MPDVKFVSISFERISSFMHGVEPVLGKSGFYLHIL